VYQASVRSTTAGTGKTVLAIVASLSLLLSLFAAALPAAAEDGTGQADCPEGTIFLDNFDQGDINVGDELVAGVFVTAVTRTDGETGELTSVTIENTTSSTITIAVKGGSDQVGNSVTIEAGGEETITVTNNPTISNLSVCQGPVSPTLTVAKATIGGDDDFQFQLDGSNAAVLSNGESEEVATTSGEFDLTEVLSQEQTDAGWALTGVDCTGNAAEEADIAGGVTVTVGADEDVICTFTNTLTPPPTPSLTVAKETVGGDDDFQFTLDDVNAALLSDGESDEVATMSGTFDLAEVLSQEQIDAGWALTAVDCSGNATEESDISGGVEVTVGADEDVVCTFTNTLTPPPPPPGEGFLEVDKLICLAETSSTTFDVDMVEVQSFALEDIGDCMFGAGVTFSVFVDANGNGELDEGEVLSDDEDLVDGTLTTNENGSITVDLPEGDYILVEEAGGNEQGTWPGGSVAFSIEDGVFTIIEVTNNIAEEEENGFLKIRKFFCDTAAPEGFDNPHFIELEGPEADTDASLPDQFAENCTRGGDNPEATFEIDGREFITDDGILVVSLPAGEHDVVETDPNEGSTTVTVEVDGTTSLLVLNFLPEQEQLGSITVQKEIDAKPSRRASSSTRARTTKELPSPRTRSATTRSPSTA
jgi:hypothetical protein